MFEIQKFQGWVVLFLPNELTRSGKNGYKAGCYRIERLTTYQFLKLPHIKLRHEKIVNGRMDFTKTNRGDGFSGLALISC